MVSVDAPSHDVSGLIGQYAHGNEPSHHIIYLNNYAGQAYKTQQLVPRVLKEQYMDKPDGLSGNDDCGQMSAWYVFSCLGFYPVNPASGIFDIGVPAYKYAEIRLGEKRFIIKAPLLSEENKYVKEVRLNGKVITNYLLSYKEIMNGGVLEFVMAKQHS
jgi:predicted alpha-1,2-mannosidase